MEETEKFCVTIEPQKFSGLKENELKTMRMQLKFNSPVTSAADYRNIFHMANEAESIEM